MSIQTTQIKLLASALGLNRADIAEIIVLGNRNSPQPRLQPRHMRKKGSQGDPFFLLNSESRQFR